MHINICPEYLQPIIAFLDEFLSRFKLSYDEDKDNCEYENLVQAAFFENLRNEFSSHHVENVNQAIDITVNTYEKTLKDIDLSNKKTGTSKQERARILLNASYWMILDMINAIAKYRFEQQPPNSLINMVDKATLLLYYPKSSSIIEEVQNPEKYNPVENSWEVKLENLIKRASQ